MVEAMLFLLLFRICDIADISDMNVTMSYLGEITPIAAEVQDLSFSVNSQTAFNDPTLLQYDMFSTIGIDVRCLLYVFAFFISVFANVFMPVPGYAVFFFKHYTTNVVNLMTLLGHTKTPWHTLFIPHVKNCFAALTMGEDLSYASLPFFFFFFFFFLCILLFSVLFLGGVLFSFGFFWWGGANL